MALDKCIDSITGAVGRDLTDEERRVVAKHAARIMRGAGSDADITKMMASFADEMKARAAISKRNTALNISFAKEFDDFRKNNPSWSGNPADSLEAMLPGSTSSRIRSKDSLGTLVTTNVEGAKAQLHSDIRNAGLTKYLASGADDKNVFMAVHAIQHGEDATKFGKNAADAAQIIVDHKRANLKRYNEAGGWIPENPDRVTRNSHDPGKIRAAGEAQWKADLSELNWAEAFHGELAGATTSQREALLSSQFQQLGNGYHLNFTPPEGPTKGFANIAGRRAHSREYIYNSPEAEFAYQQKYGVGTTVIDKIDSDLGNMARDTAIMKKLGPNAETNLKRSVDRWQKDLTEQGRGVEAKALTDKHAELMRKFWPVVAGDPLAVHGTLQRVSAEVKTLQGINHLGSVITRQIGDMVTGPQVINHYGARTPGGYMGKSFRLIMHMAGAIGDKDKIMDWAARQSLLLDSIHQPLGHANGLEMTGYGRLVKAEKLMLASTGSMGWVNRMRSRSAVEMAWDHNRLRNTPYDQLKEGYGEGLKQYGIGAKEWDIIRSTPAADLGRGFKGMDASEILHVDPERFRASPDQTANNLLKQRQALYDRYSNMISDVGNLAVNHASPAVRAIAYMGTHDGTVPGVAMRQAATFKMWTISFMRNFIGRELHGYNEGKLTTPQAMARMLTLKDGGRGMMGLGTLIASGLFWGHIVDTLHDMANGVTPLNPFDPNQAKEAMGRAFLTSSSAGLYGDFLAGEGRSVADKAWNMLGPVAGTAGQLGDGVFDAYRGLGRDDTDEKEMRALDKIMSAGMTQLPFRNYLYTKAALDYFVTDNVSEALNPGWKQRKADRLAKSGQAMILGGQ